MSRTEKLQTMEILWSDLCRDSEEMESPSWHGTLLRETEERIASGEEDVLDWPAAKQKLRGSSGIR